VVRGVVAIAVTSSLIGAPFCATADTADTASLMAVRVVCLQPDLSIPQATTVARETRDHASPSRVPRANAGGMLLPAVLQLTRAQTVSGALSSNARRFGLGPAQSLGSRSGKRKAVVVGAAVGAGVGAGMGALYCRDDCGGGAARGALVFASVGAGIGAGVGLVIALLSRP
jgi:hypothetical protein